MSSHPEASSHTQYNTLHYILLCYNLTDMINQQINTYILNITVPLEITQQIINIDRINCEFVLLLTKKQYDDINYLLTYHISEYFMKNNTLEYDEEKIPSYILQKYLSTN